MTLLDRSKMVDTLKFIIQEPKNIIPTFKTTKLMDGSVRFSGSLPKFYWGNNLKTLNFNDLSLAVEKLEDTFQTDLKHKQIFRMDLGENIYTDKKPMLYFPLMQEASNLSRIAPHANGIYFMNNRRAIKLYDKVNELKLTDRLTYSMVEGQNILRHETSFLKHLSSQFGHGIYFSNLTDKDFFNHCVNKWYSSYTSIKKIQFDFDRLVEDQESYFYYKGILSEFDNHREVIEYFKTLKKSGTWNESKYKREKRKFESFLSRNSNRTDLIQELDLKVHDSYKRLIA